MEDEPASWTCEDVPSSKEHFNARVYFLDFLLSFPLRPMKGSFLDCFHFDPGLDAVKLFKKQCWIF